MDKILNIAKQFINDPSGDYKYLGELEQGKHFVEYMFTDDFLEVFLEEKYPVSAAATAMMYNY